MRSYGDYCNQDFEDPDSHRFEEAGFDTCKLCGERADHKYHRAFNKDQRDISDGEIYAFISQLGMTEEEIAEIDAAIERALSLQESSQP